MLLLRGLGCHACARRAETALRALPGVEDASISVLRDRAHVLYDAQRTSPRELIAALSRAGYQARTAPKIAPDRASAAPLIIAAAFANLLAIDHLASDAAPRSVALVRLALAALALVVAALSRGSDPRSPRGRSPLTLAFLGALAAFIVGLLSMDFLPWDLFTRLGLGPAALQAAHADGFEVTVGILLAACLTRSAAAMLCRIARADLGLRDRARATSARRLDEGDVEEVVPSATLLPGARVRLVEGDRAPVDLELLGPARISPPGAAGPNATIDLTPGAHIEAGAVLLSGEVIGRVIRERAAVVAAMDAEVHHALDRIDAHAERPFAWSTVAMQTLFVSALSFAAFALFLHAALGGEAGRVTGVLAAITVIAGTSTAAFSLAAPAARAIAVLRARAAAVIVKDPTTLERLAAIDFACFDEASTLAPIGGGSATRALWHRGVGCRLLSGEPLDIVRPLAHRAGIAFSAGLSPGDKARIAEEIRRGGGQVLFVGRGDAEIAGRGSADVTVAIAPGQPPTAVDAPIVINGGADHLPALLDLGRALRRRLRENAAITALYNAAVIPAAALGLLSPLQAVGLLLIEAAVVLGNSARLLCART